MSFKAAPSPRGLSGILGILLLAASSASPAITAPQITIVERLYDIEGSTIAALRAQMADLGPFSSKAERHVPARMEADIGFHFSARRSGGMCRITSVTVKADITYHYPNWVDLDDATLRLADRWVAYRARLIEHEEGHGAMVVAAAHEVEAALLATSPSRSCERLRARARADGERILREMEQAQVQYDIDTAGGETQGAVLRPN